MPRCSTNAYKRLVLYFPTLNLTITNEQINGDTFSLEESLCSDNLMFGACEISCVRVTVADVSQELSGQLVVISQKVNDTYDLPLGTFIVDSAKKQTNLRFKDLICYDLMKKFDTDVTAWYNALTFPMMLKAFRESLCNYVGVEFTDSNLPNDNMQITKTIDPKELIGRDVLICTEEINGAFGHMGRDGKLKHIVLNPSYGLYPSPNLYPSQDLYPVASNDTGYAYGITDEEIHDDQMQSENDYEEYTCKEITKLQIRAEEGDIGAIVGTGENCYVIEGNFLVFGKTAEELSNIARNAFYYINKRPYKSFQLKLIGLPFVEIGDSLGFATDNFISFLMKRTLTGVQALSDTFSAEGDEEIQQVSTVNKEIIQLQGKTNVLVRTVDELSNTITNVEDGLQTQINQTDSKIELKVDKNGVINSINLSTEGLVIDASKIDITGLVTINSLKNGTTIVDGACITTGTIMAERIGTGTLTSMVIKNDNLYIDGSTIQFYGNGAIKRSGSNSWSTTNRYLDNVISFTSQTITLGQYSGDLNNSLEIPMKAINIGYSGNPSYSMVNVYAGMQCRLFVSSSDYLSFEYSSVAREKIVPHGAWDLGSSSYPFQALYINQLYHLSGGTIGFFGTTPKSRQTVSKLSTSSDLSSVITKLNALLDALGTSGYGLISL